MIDSPSVFCPTNTLLYYTKHILVVAHLKDPRYLDYSS